MTTPNTIISDLSHEIDRLQGIRKSLLSVAIRAEEFIINSEEYKKTVSVYVLGCDLRRAIDEAHHG